MTIKDIDKLMKMCKKGYDIYCECPFAKGRYCLLGDLPEKWNRNKLKKALSKVRSKKR